MEPYDYPTFVRERFTKRAAGGEGLIHAAVGLVGEVLEFEEATTRAHQVEELGDCEFYLHAGYQVLNLVAPIGARTTFLGRPRFILHIQLLEEAEKLLDQAKKVWVYGKPIGNRDVLTRLDRTRDALDAIYQFYGFSWQEILDANVVKLRKRYPTGYSDAEALARKDKI